MSSPPGTPSAQAGDQPRDGGGYDARLAGDPSSCRSAAAVLRAQAAVLADLAPQPAAAARALADALERFGADLGRAQREYAAGTRDLERNAALALAARARRRLQHACCRILPAGPLP